MGTKGRTKKGRIARSTGKGGNYRSTKSGAGMTKKTVGQKVKGTVKKARLAQLDRKATRQAAKAADKKSKGAGKLSGLGSPKSPAKKKL